MWICLHDLHIQSNTSFRKMLFDISTVLYISWMVLKHHSLFTLIGLHDLYAFLLTFYLHNNIRVFQSWSISITFIFHWKWSYWWNSDNSIFLWFSYGLDSFFRLQCVNLYLVSHEKNQSWIEIKKKSREIEENEQKWTENCLYEGIEILRF